MKLGFYPKLAWEGIRKNKRLYLPYLLTGTVMVMMYYIMSFLSETELLKHIRGGSILRSMLPLGSWIVAVFALIFLFYSNSFLLRQRNREFGLYNILGMDKRNLAHIVFWETLISGGCTLACGLVLGLAFSKLAETGMLNILNAQIDFTLRADFLSVGKTVVIFALIYALLLLKALLNVRLRNPVALLNSSNVGEKPPKTNWLFAALGVVILAGAYYIAVSIHHPVEAIVWFFIAVLMVIVATYLLFISGSVALCRLLQKNKRYYYRPNHFVSVSSMVYRMKRNGAGLASICILLTMVLVMLSSTLSLYIGAEDTLNQRYPYDISLHLSIPSIDQWNEETFASLRTSIQEKVPNQKNIQEFSFGEAAGVFTNNGIDIDPQAFSKYSLSSAGMVGYVYVVSLDDYNRIMGLNETLQPGECFLYLERWAFSGDSFSLGGGQNLKVKAVLDDMFKIVSFGVSGVPYAVLVTSETYTLLNAFLTRSDEYNQPLVSLYWFYCFDMEGGKDAQIEAYEKLNREMDDIAIRNPDGGYSYTLEGREYVRDEFYGLYGGLFFVGILLSIVFLFAAVLIIYYKQINEGYEDQKRFEIMQKVGMTKKDIRKSINSQILTVFFAPIVFAGLHLGFAFPAIWKLLQLFGFSNLLLMIIVTVSFFFVFGICYTFVYKLTANAYYHIVSGVKE
ncbi:MAG: ABC transporter permease [Clostridiales bacterium]|nr:ABC transporter permease [Clostridiales bacterium]